MVQAKLPDLNTQWIMSKREAWTAFKNRDYDGCKAALDDINAMLTKINEKDYQVQISEKKYNELIKLEKIYRCNKCKKEIPKSQVTIKKIDTSSFVRTLTNTKQETIWSCPDCKEDNILSRTDIVEPTLKEPHYLKVIPPAPERKDGIMDRRNFHKRFRSWARLFMKELSRSMAEYRNDYIPTDAERAEEEVLDGQEHLDSF